MKLYHVYHDLGYDGISTIALCTQKNFAYEIMELERSKYDVKQEIAIDEYEADTICESITIHNAYKD